MTQQQNCPVCNSVLLHESSYRNVSEHVLFDNRKIVVCDNCGFSHVAPVIEQDELNYYYEHIYRSKNSEMYIDFDSSSLDMSVVDYRSISQLLLGRQYVANKARYRLLDIGSGPGVSFISSKKIFRDVDLYAVETNRSAKRYYKQHIKGISVFDDIQEIEDKMDVVLMSHSLEHFDIHDIPRLFKEVYDVMDVDGIVIIEVPNVDFRDKDVLDKRFNDTPHVCFFSLESLRRLLEKTDFDICYLDTAGSTIAESNSDESNNRKAITMERIKAEKTLLEKMKWTFKRVLIILGVYGRLREMLSVFKPNCSFYNSEDFKYRGERTLLRCVLKKNVACGEFGTKYL